MTRALEPPHELRGILAGESVRNATSKDAIDCVEPQFVVEPADIAELARVLKFAQENALAVIPRGGGTKIRWGNPPRKADIIVSTRRLDRIIEHAHGDMTATVQAGCTVRALQDVLVTNGQRLAVDSLWPERSTVGGVLATNDSGALRLAFGPLRDSLIGITVVLADGTVARSGGKVVKNVAGYDLPKLFIGSFGTLGVIVEATFRLYPLAHAARTLAFELPTRQQLNPLLANLSNCSLFTSAVQIEAGEGVPLRVLVGVEGLAEAIEGKVAQITGAACDAGARPAESPDAAWHARESMFDSAEACICKVSLLPTQWGEFLDAIPGRFRMIGQSVGVGLLQLTASEPQSLPKVIAALRQYLRSMGGSLVVLQAPAAVKNSIDVWGDAGDALPLMRRIKDQFDPKCVLSPGRFAGGI